MVLSILLEREYGPRSKPEVKAVTMDSAYELMNIIRHFHLLPTTNPLHQQQRRRRDRDGQRGGATFEDYGCITSASELGKSFGTLAAPKMHSRIMYLESCGLLAVETYNHKNKRFNRKNKFRPYWYVRLELTEKGERFMQIYEAMDEILPRKYITLHRLAI